MPAEQSVQLTAQNISILFLTGALVHAARILMQSRIPPWRRVAVRAFLAGIVAVVMAIIAITRVSARIEEAWVVGVVFGYAGPHVLEWLGTVLWEGFKVMVKASTKEKGGGDSV